MAEMLWKFRYKHRLVQTGYVITNSDDQKMAFEVATAWLAKQASMPGVCMIPNSLAHHCDYSEDEMMRDRRAATKPISESDREAATVAGRGGNLIGAVDDPASSKATSRGPAKVDPKVEK